MEEYTMKKILALLLTLTMVLTIAGFSLAETEDVTRAAKIRIAINDDVSSLDPLGDNGQGRTMILPSYCEYLCNITGIGGELQPCIAKSWEQIDDYTYHVEIYDYVYDSAGNHITASDVAFSYKKCLEYGLLANALGMIEEVTPLDDYNVEFVLNTTAAGALTNTLNGCYIVSQAAYEADPAHMANEPIATGAYVVTEFTPGSSVKLKRNENYWQKPELTAIYSQQNVEEIEYYVILEPAQLSMALETGSVDMAGYMTQNEVANFDGLDGYTITSIPNTLSQVILFNCDASNVFANQALRQAVCYCINNEAVLKNVFDGVGGLCKTYGNNAYGDYLTKWDSEDYYDYDLDKAKEKLAEAGYKEGELTVKIMTDTISYHVRIGELMQAFLSTIGINSEIVSYDSGLYNPYRFDTTQWDLRVDNKGAGDYITSVFKYSFDQDMYGGKTQNFYTDPAMQELLVTAMAAKTHTPENIDKIHEAIKESAIGYGICYDMSNYASSDSVIKTIVYDAKLKAVPGACEYAAN